MTIKEYVKSINSRYQLGQTTEHSFRGDLQVLLESLLPGIMATNEPKRRDCGAPDYILTRNEIPVGYIEAKDLGDKDLHGQKKSVNKEQFDRYKASLENLIITDYLDFHFYRNGELIHEVKLGEISGKAVKALDQNFDDFTRFIKDFTGRVSQSIKSSKQLAQMMAAKARLLANIIENAVTGDEEKSEDSSLKEQMYAFKEILIHDITPKQFADVYAQTITYGMFAARLHDHSMDNFSRQEAAELIPRSNPFLRRLFIYIAGPDIDTRIKWIVDSLADVFLACNIRELLRDFGKETQTEDPIIHFYETFLSEYDPALRKSRGVWYTPGPVVNFIVRAVDDILKSEFGISQGLADNSKTKIKINTQNPDKRSVTGFKQIEQEVHKVQILDPATGTGTFLAEVIKQIHKKFEGQEGIWSNYVEQHMLPRLNGFEILMASYAMAHLKLDLLLGETGYKPSSNQRFRVYLTNSLEESHPDTGTLFANWLSAEANEANHIKRDTPVMCVIGNPPYAVNSTNKNEWIQDLVSDYKKNLNERKINLDDDYIKFIRYGQHYIEKNGSGVLAYISNNSFIDGITHRQMRKHLLETFDKIYILNLHGNAKKKEVCPDGSPDQNVFDIMQGVSINIFVEKDKKKKTELGEVYHFDLYGKRNYKYETLNNTAISEIKWSKLTFKKPYYFFVPKDFESEEIYKQGFKIDNLFQVNNSGVSTDRDSLFLDNSSNKLTERIRILLSGEYGSKFKDEFNVKDSSGYPLLKRISKKEFSSEFIVDYHYRPFDIKKIYFDKTIISRPAKDISNHFNKENIYLIVPRQVNKEFHHIFSSRLICDSNITSSARLFGAGKLFPLYIYPEPSGQQSIEQKNERTPNLNPNVIAQIAEKIGLTFTNEKETTENTFAPIDILDYIYAVLHSPTYREKYKEFLKIDFPRVPYPEDKETFWQLVELGGQIRQIHLLESPIVNNYITRYPVNGSNTVEKIRFEEGKVFINDEQYFDQVPEIAWNFYIGGYQPAQKWLKDRKGRHLAFEDIMHYQKIIVALTETDRLMKEIDGVGVVID